MAGNSNENKMRYVWDESGEMSHCYSLQNVGYMLTNRRIQDFHTFYFTLRSCANF